MRAENISLEKVKAWMHWRGITVKDLVFTFLSMGMLLTMVAGFLYGAWMA